MALAPKLVSAVQDNAATVTSRLKHAALETAGVKAADIRNEDASDPVWQAAEAAEKNANKGGKNSKVKVQPYVRPDHLIGGHQLAHRRMHGMDGAEWDQDKMYWFHPESPEAHAGPPSTPAPYEDGSKSPLPLSEDHFLSLSFGNALQPSKVIPYYYRASDPDRIDFRKEDITITTLVTSNRFEVFQRLVERYQGSL
jgi:glycosyltransferase-like protein LARGE